MKLEKVFSYILYSYDMCAAAAMANQIVMFANIVYMFENIDPKLRLIFFLSTLSYERSYLSKTIGAFRIN
jgi:hypothetical protein